MGLFELAGNPYHVAKMREAVEVVDSLSVEKLSGPFLSPLLYCMDVRVLTLTRVPYRLGNSRFGVHCLRANSLSYSFESQDSAAPHKDRLSR
jgi:hypothetical protein